MKKHLLYSGSQDTLITQHRQHFQYGVSSNTAAKIHNVRKKITYGNKTNHCKLINETYGGSGTETFIFGVTLQKESMKMMTMLAFS